MRELNIKYLSNRLKKYCDLNQIRSARGGIDFTELREKTEINEVTLRGIIDVKEGVNPTLKTVGKILNVLGEKMVCVKEIENQIQ